MAGKKKAKASNLAGKKAPGGNKRDVQAAAGKGAKLYKDDALGGAGKQPKVADKNYSNLVKPGKTSPNKPKTGRKILGG